MDYIEFLRTKQSMDDSTGLSDIPELSPMLYPFQRDIVSWALRRGRAAIWADCGLGKTPMQLEWARHVPGNVLILAPLAVSAQTVREGEKFGIPVHYCRSQDMARPGINITNYEMLEHFECSEWTGIVLDESSILKAFGGVVRKAITEFGESIPFRLACTATPAPNDIIELTNHSEFLNIMTGKEMIALYFTQDGNTTHSWRLKGHARADFWAWVSTWAVALRRPSDLGYPDEAFVLPRLDIVDHVLDAKPLGGQLFPMIAQTLQERRQARRESIGDRVSVCAELANGNDEQWLIWCNLNDESAMLTKTIEGAVEVKGADTRGHKESTLMRFAAGEVRVMVTKPLIAGFGMNFQACRNMAFVGLSDSYEQYYQAVRRCWRFGQKREVHAHVITSEAEGAVVANIKRKEIESTKTMDEVVKNMDLTNVAKATRTTMALESEKECGENWELYLGDSIDTVKNIDDDSVGLCLFSPPFPGMYAYTNSPNDIGNSTHIEEFMEHYRFLIPELLRVTAPGRLCCVHLMQLTAMKNRDGYIGLKDYRGRLIQDMINGGWRYAGEATIDKNPQVQATRNKERGLLFKSLATDSSMMRMALADYLIYFRKDGENTNPIHAGISQKYNSGGGWISEKEWIEWASPVWYRQTKDYPGGIRETDCLNVTQARETDDERHLCPLQLGVIERAVKLWSAPGDLVYSPFAGVGSEGVMALRLERRFVGGELKRSYWESACRNLRSVRGAQISMFDSTV